MTDGLFMVAHVLDGWTPDERSGFYPQYFFSEMDHALGCAQSIRDLLLPGHQGEIKVYELREVKEDCR